MQVSDTQPKKQKLKKRSLPNIGAIFKACKSGGWMAQNHPRFPNRGTDRIRQAADREFLLTEELEWQTGRWEKDEWLKANQYLHYSCFWRMQSHKYVPCLRSQHPNKEAGSAHLGGRGAVKPPTGWILWAVFHTLQDFFLILAGQYASEY